MGFVSSLGRDLKFALRQMRQTPIVSGIALLSLALGIGANVAIFSLVNALMLKPLPVHEPDRLVIVGLDAPNVVSTSLTNPQWEYIRDHQQVLVGDGGVRQSALQPELRRRNPQRAGPVRQRAILRHARRARAHRTDLYRRRRSTRRRTRRAGRGPELRLLAARIRRQQRRDRQADRPRRPLLHHHRRVAARLPRRADRPRLRRRRAARHRADHSRRRELSSIGAAAGG